MKGRLPIGFRLAPTGCAGDFTGIRGVHGEGGKGGRVPGKNYLNAGPRRVGGFSGQHNCWGTVGSAMLRVMRRVAPQKVNKKTFDSEKSFNSSVVYLNVI